MVNCDFSIAKQLNFLGSLSEKEKNRLHTNSESKIIRKGDIIFLKDELLQKVFCIREGAYKFSILDDTGKEHITKLLGEGELMGRRALVSKKGAMVTATALTEGKLCCLDKGPLLDNILNNAIFCFDVLKGFVADTEEEQKKLELFKNNRSIKKRLAGLLLYIKEKFGTNKDGSLLLTLKREDMANILGTSSEYIITLLTRFKDEKLVKLIKGQIVIISENKLREVI